MGVREKKLISDIALFTLSNFGSKVLVFLMVPLYTSTLSTTEYGVADLFTVTISILVPLLTLSITEATMRFLLDKGSKKGAIFTITLLLIIISIVMIICVTPWVLSSYKNLKPYTVYFILMYSTGVLSTGFSSFTRGLDETKVFAIKGLLYTVVVVSLNLLFLLVFHLGLEGYLLSIILANATSIVYMLVAAREVKYVKSIMWDKNLFKEMVTYSVPMIPTILAWWVMQVSDKYVIIAYLGLAVSGIYGVAYKIPSILAMVSTLFNQAWQITAVQASTDSDYNVFFKRIYDMYFITCIGLSSLLIIISKPLGKLVFAKEFFVAWQYVPILLVAYFFAGLSGVMATAFTARKKTSVLFHSTLVGAAFNLLFNIVFIPTCGAIAAAITTMLGFLITCLIRNYCAKKYYGMKLNGFKEGFSAILLIGEAIAITANFKLSTYVGIVLILAIGILNRSFLKVTIQYLITTFLHMIGKEN